MSKNRLVAIAAAIGLVVSLSSPALAVENVKPVASSAQIESMSVEQLEKYINQLKARLDEMKKGSLCFISDNVLSLGDGEDDGMSDQVRRLQDFLREKVKVSWKSTGLFGKNTRAALSNFQRDNGLTVTGEFDAATRAKAHSMYCKSLRKPSNQKEVEKKEIEKKELEKKNFDKSVSVSGITAKSSEKKVIWQANGYSAQGFKVVWSQDPQPTYPTRDGDRYQYFSESNRTASEDLEAFDGAGTYYVRVCQYLGDKCGVYSNEVVVNLK